MWPGRSSSLSAALVVGSVAFFARIFGKTLGAVIYGCLEFSTYTLSLSQWAREDTRRKRRFFMSDFPAPARRGKSDNGGVALWSADQPWLEMSMGRQVPVGMFHDAVVLFAGSIQWVHMNHGVGEMLHMVQQL